MNLILASKSASRQTMLSAAGVDFTAIPAAIDERALELSFIGADPATIVVELAKAKAQAVSADYQDSLVLGSDSLVVVAGQRYDKPVSKAEAAAHLRAFSGQTMLLHSAAALVRDRQLLWQYGEVARLHVRPLSEGFITRYLADEWPAVAGCVGVFRIEGRGVQLFDAIEGGHFTVLGMPLLPVLSALREFGQ